VQTVHGGVQGETKVNGGGKMFPMAPLATAMLTISIPRFRKSFD